MTSAWRHGSGLALALIALAGTGVRVAAQPAPPHPKPRPAQPTASADTATTPPAESATTVAPDAAPLPSKAAAAKPAAPRTSTLPTLPPGPHNSPASQAASAATLVQPTGRQTEPVAVPASPTPPPFVFAPAVAPSSPAVVPPPPPPPSAPVATPPSSDAAVSVGPAPASVPAAARGPQPSPAKAVATPSHPRGPAPRPVVGAHQSTPAAQAGAAQAGAAEALRIKCGKRLGHGCGPASAALIDTPVPPFQLDPAPDPTETLAEAIDAAYRTSPTLQEKRYSVRASDETYAQAESELRPTSQLQIYGNYTKTVPGRTTQATRTFAGSPIITSNSLTATVTVTQPLYTGGRADADREVAIAEVRAGRAGLRTTEGDVLLNVLTYFANVRRDSDALRLYGANMRQLEGTLDEVKARQVAGELTRTDIALAQTQLLIVRSDVNSTRQQFESDRATFAALVGHEPGVLAPPPPLPGLPHSLDEALDEADRINPDLQAAIETERQSRAQIAVARSAGRPTVSVQGFATLTGQASPYALRNEDQTFEGQAVLTIPLTTGGKVRSEVAQAQDRNAADRMGIEAARRQVVQNIVTAWDAMVSARRNVAVDQLQVEAARTYDEGTFAEYRAGLRSTFDVLYAHATRRDSEIALVTAQHDQFVAEATLLRYVGLLEARTLLAASALYDPAPNFARAARRAATPWDGVVVSLDQIHAPSRRPLPVRPLPAGANHPQSAPAGDAVWLTPETELAGHVYKAPNP